MSFLDEVLSSEAPSLVRHAMLEPAAGAMVPVAAAVYAGEERYRINQDAPVLEADAEGFLFGQSGERAPSVVISSVAAEASRAEPAIYHDPEFWPWLPAVEILPACEADRSAAIDAALKNATGKGSAVVLDTPERREELEAFLAASQSSSWELSHRHIDGWVRYALLPSGKSLWASQGSSEYRRVVSSDPGVIAGVSLNSLVWGYWLASGATSTHRRARSVSTQIIGSGVSPSPVFATKSPGRFPASAATRLEVRDGELAVVKDLKKVKPSQLGLGAVIQEAGAAPQHFTCESIASLTSISLSDVRALRRAGVGESVLRACVGVAVVATELAGADLHLRSECDLVEVDRPRWGLRERGRRGAIPVDVDLPQVRAETLSALEDAVREGALAVGSPTGVDKLRLQMSAPMAQVMLEAVLATAAKASSEE